MAGDDVRVVSTPAALDESKKTPVQDFREGSGSSIREIPAIEQTRLQRWFLWTDSMQGLETRGIERVPEDLRHPKVTAASYVQMFLVWFSIDCTANNLTVGILGPVTFGLGFKDAIICCAFGTIFGSVCTGYISTFGPISGLRTLVVARYTMGYWPSKICVLLGIVINVGYGLVDSLIAGLILTAVNGHGMTVIVGIIVSAVITLVVATFGIKWFHTFERYVWIPSVLLLFILIGCAGPNFDIHSASQHSGATLAGNRLSYVFLAASVPLGWATAGADFYSYYPASTTSRPLTALATTAGITLGKLLIESLGIGLASGLATVPRWAAAYSSDHSVGALLVEAYAGPLGAGFGKTCAVVLALCITANNVPGTYASALELQMLGRWPARVPRPLWTTFVVVVFTVAAIAGRTRLLDIFLNFLSLIGYWVIIWVVLTVEEEYLFRARHGGAQRGGYDWDAWADTTRLPVGRAALVSFLVGWAGAILGMYQTYYTGPIANMVGNGADLGLPIAMSWAGLAFPPLRYLELRYFGR